jgi:hypothetical protein
MICLDTDIMVEADSWDNLTRKMEDATILYLRSFSDEELETGAYIRKAPLSYQIRWELVRALMTLFHWLSSPSKAIYDPQSSRLRFA